MLGQQHQDMSHGVCIINQNGNLLSSKHDNKMFICNTNIHFYIKLCWIYIGDDVRDTPGTTQQNNNINNSSPTSTNDSDSDLSSSDGDYSKDDDNNSNKTEGDNCCSIFYEDNDPHIHASLESDKQINVLSVSQFDTKTFQRKRTAVRGMGDLCLYAHDDQLSLTPHSFSFTLHITLRTHTHRKLAE